MTDSISCRITVRGIHPADRDWPASLRNGSVELLRDGAAIPPAEPWLDWYDLGLVDSGWHAGLSLGIDAFRTQLDVEAITFAEDPAHPESWLRDVRLQWWDAAGRLWRDGPYLLSDTAVHSHTFPALQASRFRFGDPAPDDPLVQAMPADVTVRYDGTLAAPCLERTAAGQAVPLYTGRPFGHAVPDWDFTIAEQPGPGQYGYLQFAWKALPGTAGMSLLVGREWPGGGLAVTVGEGAWSEGLIAERRLTGQVPTEWTTVRVDLWALSRGAPPPVYGLGLMSNGGGARFAHITLARTEADLTRHE